MASATMTGPGDARDVAPVLQRLRLRHTRTGPLRFSSHRDFQRAFERALRRADVPIASSAGFTPHPKISYANAAATGKASLAEYVEIGLTAACDPAAVARALDTALPEGLDVVDGVEARTPDFVARLEASRWRIELPGVTPTDVQNAVAALLAADRVEVERLTKSGVRRFDARGPVHAAVVSTGVDGDPCAILTAVVRHVAPAVRPDDVLAALRSVADLVPPVPPRVTRLAQGPLVAGERVADHELADLIGDPLAPDRNAAPLVVGP